MPSLTRRQNWCKRTPKGGRCAEAGGGAVAMRCCDYRGRQSEDFRRKAGCSGVTAFSCQRRSAPNNRSVSPGRSQKNIPNPMTKSVNRGARAPFENRIGLPGSTRVAAVEICIASTEPAEEKRKSRDRPTHKDCENKKESTTPPRRRGCRRPARPAPATPPLTCSAPDRL